MILNSKNINYLSNTFDLISYLLLRTLICPWNKFNCLSLTAMEEEKSIYNQKDKIKDARSERRQQFTKIKTVDPRDRLRELPLKQAKDRRQSIFEENRSKNNNWINLIYKWRHLPPLRSLASCVDGDAWVFSARSLELTAIKLSLSSLINYYQATFIPAVKGENMSNIYRHID